jgi:hypothetical protein
VLIARQKIPCSVAQGILLQAVEFARRLGARIAGGGRGDTFVEVEPNNDMLVFFPAWFPHEVMPVECLSGRFEDSRFAINCWIHRNY